MSWTWFEHEIMYLWFSVCALVSFRWLSEVSCFHTRGAQGRTFSSCLQTRKESTAMPPSCAPWKSCRWHTTAGKGLTKVGMAAPHPSLHPDHQTVSKCFYHAGYRDPWRGFNILNPVWSSIMGCHFHGGYSRCFPKSLPGVYNTIIFYSCWTI